MPKYSIVIPVYNVENYIEKCVDSILKQEYKDFEIIIVDDGSTDRSIFKITEIVENNSDKIKIIRQENKGLGGARNTGLEQARGEYVWFVDSDDTIRKDALAVLNCFLEKEKADVVVFNLMDIDEQGNYLTKESGVTLEYKGVFSLEEMPQMLFMSPSACNKVFKRTLLEQNHIRFPEHVWFEDLSTIPKIYLHAKTIGYIDEELYLYLQRKGSIMKNSNIEKNKDIMRALDEISSYYQHDNVYNCFKEEIEYLAIVNVYLLASVRVLKGDKKSCLISELKKYMENKFPKYKENKYYSLLPRKHKIVIQLLNKKYYWLLKKMFQITGKNR